MKKLLFYILLVGLGILIAPYIYLLIREWF